MTDLDSSASSLESFHGTLLAPGTTDYDDARAVFNGMIDRSPAMIARCADSTDVVSALVFARDKGLDVTVYGGGHAVTGAAVADDAICIDLRGMKDIDIDVETAVARVGGGCIWRELDAAGEAHGLAVTGGQDVGHRCRGTDAGHR